MNLLIKKWSFYLGLVSFCLTTLLGLVSEVPPFIILARAVAAFVIFRMLGQVPIRVITHIVLKELAAYQEAKPSGDESEPRRGDENLNLNLETSKAVAGKKKGSVPEREKELVLPS